MVRGEASPVELAFSTLLTLVDKLAKHENKIGKENMKDRRKDTLERNNKGQRYENLSKQRERESSGSGDPDNRTLRLMMYTHVDLLDGR